MIPQSHQAPQERYLPHQTHVLVAPGKEFDRCMRECLGSCRTKHCPFAGCAVTAAVFEGGAGEQLEFDFETRH